MLVKFLIDNKAKISKDQFLFIVRAYILSKRWDEKFLFNIFLNYDIDKYELENYIDSIKEKNISFLEELFLMKLVFNMMAEIKFDKNSKKYKQEIKYISKTLDYRIKNEQFSLKNRKKNYVNQKENCKENREERTCTT